MPEVNRPDEADDRIRPMPGGYQVVTPWIISREGGRLLEFDAEVFGAEGIARLRDEDGTIEHAEFRIGDSMGLYVVMAFDAREGWPDTPGFFRLSVENGAMPSTGGRSRPSVACSTSRSRSIASLAVKAADRIALGR